MNGKLKIGVIGLGGMGKVHVRGYQSHPQAEVVAICDTNAERVHAAAEEFHIPEKFTNAEKMFRNIDLDAVSIATPNKFHAPLTITAFQAGLHVLCEKPMAMNVKEAEQMNNAAQKADKNLMINFSFRFNDMSYALKKQVESDIIGDIYFGRTVWHRRRGIPGLGGWFTDKELSGGGPLIDLGVHRLDLALWLMGYPEPTTVSGAIYNMIAKRTAIAKHKKFTVEDLACGFIKFKNGAVLILETSWALNIKKSKDMVTMLCGTKGGLVQRNTEGYNFTTEIYTEENGYLFTKTLDQSTIPTPSPFYEFVNSIIEKRKPVATGEEGVKVMRILDGIYQSARTGKEVRF